MGQWLWATRWSAVVDVLRIPHRMQFAGRRPTVRVGFARFTEAADDVENLVRLADVRLFQAKRAGRNRVGPKSCPLLTGAQRCRPIGHRRVACLAGRTSRPL
ncbi:diguanylate cyclase domain-containing protein [Rhizobacter fulvus]